MPAKATAMRYFMAADYSTRLVRRMAAWLSEPRRHALIVLIATVLGMAVTARLGVWQLSRAAQKEILQAALDARSGLPELSMAGLPTDAAAAEAQHYRPVRLRGEVEARGDGVSRQPPDERPPRLLCANALAARPQRRRAGSTRLVTARHAGPQPRTRGADPQRACRSARPDRSRRPGRLFDFAGPAASGVIRQNLALADFSRELGVSLRPWTVLQTDVPGSPADGLLRHWPRPAADVHKHYGYAFQWFALCALMAGLYVWFQLLRPRRQRSA